MVETKPTSPPQSRRFLRRPAHGVLAAAVLSSFLAEVCYVFLPVALASQGISLASTPQWFDYFLSYGLPVMLFGSSFLSMTVPKRRREDDRVLELEKDLFDLRRRLAAQEDAPRGTQALAKESPYAQETQLKPELDAKTRQRLYATGKKLWEGY